jgi:transcriptional regulator with XRE-family HTH domain
VSTLSHPDPLTLQLGQALRSLRQSKGLNLEDLSRLSGVGIATLSNLENGNRDPKLSTITRILKALRSDLRDLLFPALTTPSGSPSSTKGYHDLDI